MIKRLKSIRIVLMDVDGVLTDGSLFHFFDARDRFIETKGVDTQDGLALSWLASNGIQTGVISGRSSRGLAERARLLGMKHVVQGTTDKVPKFLRILKKTGLTPEQAAFIGDDFTDAPVMRLAGWPIAVANARPEIKAVAKTVTRRPGGRGAVREAAEMLLKAQGLWGGILKKYGLP